MTGIRNFAAITLGVIVLFGSFSCGPDRVTGVKGRQQAIDNLLAGEFNWKVSRPLVEPLQREGDFTYSVKDPSIVRYKGKWHLFCTLRGKERSHRVEYISFDDWDNVESAERHYLNITDGYYCAPQVFYFEPHEKWYLIYQTLGKPRTPALQPAWSTNDDISNPQSWSKPTLLFEENPDNAAAHNNLARLLSAGGKPAEAGYHYEQALRIDSGYVDAHFNYGRLMIEQGRMSEALKRFAEAIRIDPDYARAYNGIGAILAVQGNYLQAEPYFRKAVELDPGDDRNYTSRAWAYEFVENPEAAIDDYTRAIEIAPEEPWNWNQRGWCYARLGDRDAAIDNLTVALEMTAGNPGWEENKRNIEEYMASE